MKADEVPTVDNATLERALGRWDLTGIGINQVIGGAIFLIPSQVALAVGGWSVGFVVLAGVSSLFVALCFAEAGSRFDGTGGAYVYTRAAFGRFIGFEIGWMQWFTRVTSQASVVNGIAVSVAYYWSAAADGLPRAALITLLTAALAAVNVVGIRQSAWLVNALTHRQAGAAARVHRVRSLVPGIGMSSRRSSRWTLRTSRPQPSC